MEFLRFGSSIPGSYWGCCAVCIIQNFKFDPDEKASIELVDGDGGNPMVKNGKGLFLGKTYREIFQSRLRIGTFSGRDMPNHVFLAILTAEQIGHGYGAKWLKILKENGFEFVRATDNSVYSGKSVISKPGAGTTSSHPNYIFGLFRNIGKGAMEDPYTPPKEWTDLPSVVPEAWQYISESGDEQARINGCTELTTGQQKAQLKLWKSSSPAVLYTEEELEAAGVPVTLAGRRSDKPQQLKCHRKESTTTTAVGASPFGVKASAPVAPVSEPTYDLDFDDDCEDEYSDFDDDCEDEDDDFDYEEI